MDFTVNYQVTSNQDQVFVSFLFALNVAINLFLIAFEIN